MTEHTNPPIEFVRKGDVDEAAVEYATKRLDSVMEHVGVPVLFTRVRMSNDATAQRTRPSLAQATLDLNGELLRAQVAADTMPEAIDLLADRLRDQLQHRAERRRARRATGRIAQPGEWRHGDLRDDRPLFAEIPADEREVVRRKSFATHPATPDEAAADMEQLDYDFWLFHDLASDADALIEHVPEGGYRLQRMRPVDDEAGPLAIDLTVLDQGPPTATLTEATRQLDDGGLRSMFFVDADTGRGNLVYRRYDGHYGVLIPA
ncbi:MAG TPA: HPF/RaiA family ribosome-associated protein [Ilumatobacter sp.]|nr:HPF/RaiA family ribosome-associated protein [Ilumatobacter sp.]